MALRPFSPSQVSPHPEGEDQQGDDEIAAGLGREPQRGWETPSPLTPSGDKTLARRTTRQGLFFASEELGMTTAQDRMTIYGPKADGTHIVEFKTATGEALAISIPRTEAAVVRHFQAKMPYGLVIWRQRSRTWKS